MSWEVWTMKSKTSFFDPTLLKKNISRFAPAWAILTLAFFLSLPLPLIRGLRQYGMRTGTEQLRLAEARDLLNNALPVGTVFAFLAAILFAALVFKYLHRTKDAYMMHAFPMTRNCQFLTNGVSGLLFWIVPTLFTGLCTLGVLAAYHISGCGGEVWSLLSLWLLAFLCFYGIAVFAMQLSGRTVIAVLSYVALNFMFLAVPLLCLMLVNIYFKGFDYVITERILRLAPIVELLNVESARPLMFWIYGAVGLILLALCWVLYRFRHVERAGDAMVYPWARIAFRLLFTLCVTLGLGWILASIFSLVGGDGKGAIFLPYALISCFLGWFGSSMMLERTVKVFKKKKVWIGFAAFAGVLILAVACMKYDLLGFQRRVPETDRVASVEIWTHGDYDDPTTDRISLTAPADIEVVRSFHEKAIQSSQTTSGTRDLFGYNDYGEVHVLYHLNGGGTLRRVYEVPYPEQSGLAALYSRADLAAAWYEQALPEDFYRVTLYGVQDIEEDLYGRKSYAGEELDCKDPAALKAAILADAQAGRLPVMNFLTGGDYYDGKEIIQRGYYELYLYYELKEQPGQYTPILQIPIASTAEETLKLFLP